MKEPEKAEIKRLSDQLDAVNHKSQPLLEAGDMEKLGELQWVDRGGIRGKPDCVFFRAVSITFVCGFLLSGV